MVIINSFLSLIFIIIGVEGIIVGELETLLFMILGIIILTFNTISIISKNRYINRLEDSYYVFIKKVSEYEDKMEYEELKKFLEDSRKSGLYKRIRMDNSDYPTMEQIYDWHDVDRI